MLVALAFRPLTIVLYMLSCINNIKLKQKKRNTLIYLMTISVHLYILYMYMRSYWLQKLWLGVNFDIPLQYKLNIVHLKMQCDVWLDNVINLRQYILRYTVGNPTSLRNVAFHWLISEYMQLASGFMQLAAAGCIGATKYIFTVLWRENVNSAFGWR